MNKLILLLTNYDLEKFYTVTLRTQSIDLQGKAHKETIDYCKSLGFEFSFSATNWLEATKGKITITLTF